tara:strand:+ start:4103 stop:4294 length:192 start_codon:yes stop_codon:yes gene_type:complete
MEKKIYYKTRKDMFMDNPCTKEEYELEKLKEELEWWRTYGEYVNANYSGVCAEASAYADGDVD